MDLEQEVANNLLIRLHDAMARGLPGNAPTIGEDDAVQVAWLDDHADRLIDGVWLRLLGPGIGGYLGIEGEIIWRAAPGKFWSAVARVSFREMIESGMPAPA